MMVSEFKGVKMVHEEDIQDLREFIESLESQGAKVPQSIKSDLAAFINECGFLGLCDSCTKLVVFPPEYAEGEDEIWPGNNYGDFALCEDCGEGKPGHEAYHRYIEERKFEQHNQSLPRKWSSDRRHEHHKTTDEIARKEHLDCPWFARGEPCDYVSQIQDDDRHEEEMKQQRAAEKEWLGIEDDE